MVSLEATYFNGYVDEIQGQIINNTNDDWSYVELIFALYDEEGNQVGNAYARIADEIGPGDITDFKMDEGGVYHLYATRYKLISVSPI